MSLIELSKETKTELLGKMGSIKKRKLSTSTAGIINDIMEKNFAVTHIVTNDFYSFETSLKEEIGNVDRSLLDIEHIFMVDCGGVRAFEKEKVREDGKTVERYNFIEINSDNRPDIIDGQLEAFMEAPIFGIMLLKKLDNTLKEQGRKNDKNKIVIIKDFNLLFKNRKEQLQAYHRLESEYDFLSRTDSKIIILNKGEVESLSEVEVEMDIIKYTYSNRKLKNELIEVTKEILPEATEGMDNEYFLDLTGHLTYCELENIIKDGFENYRELEEKFEQRKMKKIMEANPEIKISKPTIKMDELIGFNNAKNFITKGMEKEKIKSLVLGGVPGTGIFCK